MLRRVMAVAVGLTLAVNACGAGDRTRSSKDPVAYAAVSRPSRLSASDYELVQEAAHLRAMAVAPRRSALFRSFAASMGLSLLLKLHPIAPGRCSIAVTDLYNNLLDLDGAYPGEDWAPLRRAIRHEPSLTVCKPPPRHVVPVA